MMAKSETFLEEYLALRRVSQNTKNLYRQAVESFEKNANTPIQNLDKTVLTRWLVEVQKTLSPASIEKYAQILRILYAHKLREETGLSKRKAHAEAADLFDLVPFRDLRARSKIEADKRDQVVTPKEFKILLDAVNHPRGKALIAVTYESGCRKSEVLSLRLKDIQASETHWSIKVKGKTGERVVPLIKSVPYLRAWLQIHPGRDNDNTPVFVSSFKGKIRGLNEHSFNNLLRLLCEKTGIRMINPHMFRHTRMTNLADEGLGEFQMKSFAGWSADSKMAARYIHMSGRTHMNAVLEKGGIDTENGGTNHKPESLIIVTNCPSCDSTVGQDMIHCPRCGYILDDRMRIENEDKTETRQTQLEQRLMTLIEEVEKLKNKFT